LRDSGEPLPSREFLTLIFSSGPRQREAAGRRTYTQWPRRTPSRRRQWKLANSIG